MRIIFIFMGAKNYGRVRELYRKILLCTVVIGLASTALFEIAPRAVVGMFGAPTNIPTPEDYNIKRVMEVYGDTVADAKHNVHRADNARAAYYKNVSELT